jgi:hypothetical protein
VAAPEHQSGALAHDESARSGADIHFDHHTLALASSDHDIDLAAVTES